MGAEVLMKTGRKGLLCGCQGEFMFIRRARRRLEGTCMYTEKTPDLSFNFTVMVEQFVGTWTLSASENFDDYMKAIGVGFATRQMGNVVKPNLVISLDDAGVISMKSESTFKNTEIKFKINEEFDENTADGRQTKTTITFENGKLVQKQTWDGKATTLEREIQDGKLTALPCLRPDATVPSDVARDAVPSSNMADQKNTNMEVDEEKNKPAAHKVKPLADELGKRTGNRDDVDGKQGAGESRATAEYCEKLQAWMWQYYTGYVNWQSWLAASAMSYPPHLQPGGGTATSPPLDFLSQHWYNSPFGPPLSPYSPAVGSPSSRGGEAAGGAAVPGQPPPPQENGHAQRPGREYGIPSPLQRLLAEMVDFFILFFIKATIIISMMHLSGIKDVSKFAMHFIVEEIDEDTSMEELQKMMLVALVYRILVCFYEIVCIWGAGGATPGKFLIGLRVVTCDSSVLVQPNRVLVVPATNVSLSASTVRALNKNFSIAFFFPAFITLLFFQHNRTVYDMVAGTIVVKRSRAR
ncbi:putative protein FAM8A1-like [Scophthalmus maximus]|uniref:Cellular retinoic acid-binding protein 1 n=1 Tax=Scophthalmus maximus TaxID=52904 RepID=A0A2U9AYI1_SCOMX|nr:putative protein FAM8A1-like [Scophthalmus maximus]